MPKPQTHHRTARRGATVVAVLALLVAACGDDSEERAETSVVDSGDDLGPATTGPTEPEDDPVTPAGEDDSADPGALLLIMDSSGSMNSRDDASGERLIDLAKDALGDVIEELPDDQHVGLRVYGHRYPNTDRENGCQDTELIHPVGPLDRPALLDSIEGYDAQGFTPIGLSLREGAADLPPEGQRSIVLVSDGQETCDTDPCQAADEIAGEGIDLVVHTVGFVLDMAAPDEATQARDELSCIAETTGGSFVEVEEAADLADAIEDIARDDRGLASEGSLAGNPVPRDAATGAVNTSYTDKVRGVETNYYRFEIEAGSEVVAELTRLGNPDVGTNINSYQCEQVHVTDVGGQALATAGVTAGTSDAHTDGRQTQTWHTESVRVDSDEVWLKVETVGCGGLSGFPDDEYDVQLRLTVVD